MKKLSLILVLVLALSMVLGASAMAEFKGVTLKISHNLSSTDILQGKLEEAAAKILERTEGKVEFQIYPNGELVTYAEAVEAITSGSNIVYYCAFSDWKDYVPGVGAFSAAYVFDSIEQYLKFMETDFYAGILAEMEAQGIHGLQTGWIGGYRHTLTHNRVDSPADLKGQSIRIPANPVWIDCFESLGMNTSGLAWADTLPAVSTGDIDSMEGTYGTITAYNLWDYWKHITETNHIMQAEGLWMSADVWASIPAEYQAIVEEEMKAAQMAYVQASIDKEESMRAACIEHGMEINRDIDLAPFKEAAGKYVLTYDIGAEMLEVLAGLN